MPATVPAADRFTVSAAHATGAYQGETAAAVIVLKPAASPTVGTQTPLTAQVTGSRCLKGSHHCPAMSGRLTGTIVEHAPAIPDTGATYTITLRGQLSGVGAVTAAGTVHGTGFIAQGRESMVLTLRAAHGSFAMTGQTGLAPGFTGP